MRLLPFDVARRRLQPGREVLAGWFRDLPVLLGERLFGDRGLSLAGDTLLHKQPGDFKADFHSLLFDLIKLGAPLRIGLRSVDANS